MSSQGEEEESVLRRSSSVLDCGFVSQDETPPVPHVDKDPEQELAGDSRPEQQLFCSDQEAAALISDQLRTEKLCVFTVSIVKKLLHMDKLRSCVSERVSGAGAEPRDRCAI
ncbi:unnamed protein product [Pleuronectes platessa]|uniref:Uncharacterized protein n=1 Tax=Pleuronectes platessa TaxID=8262 RepID=A0A9N7W1S5_PLEPL|nr:unnamed protein product [Pleuronectes platessa]